MRALKLRNDQAFTFLLICKTDPVMRKCINKDIQKLICSMILIDYGECFHPMKMIKNGKMFWKGPDGKYINPCPHCLAPCIEVEDVNFDEDRFACHISCEVHGLLYTKLFIVTGIGNDQKDQRFNDCQKCLPYGMCIPCFKRKEKKYQF